MGSGSSRRSSAKEGSQCPKTATAAVALRKGPAGSGEGDYDEGIVQPAAAAPVRRLFRRERVDGATRAAGIQESAERHPRDAGTDAIGHRAHGSDLSPIVPDPHSVAARYPPSRGV